MFDNTVMEAFYSYSYLIAVIASVTLFMFMTGLNFLFKKMAHLLTEWEYPRTQDPIEIENLRRFNQRIQCGYHKIVHFACERDFHEVRNHMLSTLFESANLSRKARNHTFSTHYGTKVY